MSKISNEHERAPSAALRQLKDELDALKSVFAAIEGLGSTRTGSTFSELRHPPDPCAKACRGFLAMIDGHVLHYVMNILGQMENHI